MLKYIMSPLGDSANESGAQIFDKQLQCSTWLPNMAAKSHYRCLVMIIQSDTINLKKTSV